MSYYRVGFRIEYIESIIEKYLKLKKSYERWPAADVVI